MVLRTPILACCMGIAIGACESAHRQLHERTSLHYEVMASAGGETLAIEAVLTGSRSETLVVDSEAMSFVHDVELAEGSQWVALPAGTSFTVSGDDDARLRYRFELGDCARHLNEMGSAAQRDGALLASPSVWLLRPDMLPDDTDITWTVSCPPGTEFVSGVNQPPDSGPSTYGSSVANLGEMPYSAFGAFARHRLDRREGTIEIAIPRGTLALSDEDVVHWVGEAAHALECYFGRMPVAHVLIIVLPVPGDEVDFGSTMGGGGATIVMFVGREIHSIGLDRDWVMTHELVHLAVPSMPRSHLWLSEGIATYVEPLARARVGAIEGQQVWLDLVRGLPKGLPARGDRGLDRTWTWGRTYWGGALFCFLADLEIREQTGNRASLDDALRAVAAAGGNISVRWPIERWLAAGDEATGTHVLSELYGKMGESPAGADLDSIWRKLGVSLRRGSVRFDDTASLAAIRRAMLEPCAN
jgi:hypothetical protein